VNKGVFFALIYFSLVVAVVAVMFVLLWPFLSSVAWAGVIALATHPLYRWYLRRVGGRENLAAGMTTVTVMIIIIVPLVVVALLFIGQATQVLFTLQKLTAEGHIPGREEILANPHVIHLIQKYPSLAELDFTPILLGAMNTVSSLVVGASKILVINVFTGLFKLFLMVAILFFAFRDGEKIANAFWDIVPFKESDKVILEDTVRRVVSAVLYGVVLTFIVQGILGGIGFAIVGIPSPVFFGAVMIICAFIPVLGTAIVWVPAALYLLLSGFPGKALFLALWGVLIISSIDNFIRPYFISTRSKIPLLVILLGVRRYGELRRAYVFQVRPRQPELLRIQRADTSRMGSGE
jgi:predicted PurR-regulated permease PerM